MPNYADGKVYLLVCAETGKRYVGSTTLSLCRRLSLHKSNAPKNSNRVTQHFEGVGWDRARIELVERVACADKFELHEREEEVRQRLAPELNQVRAFSGVYCTRPPGATRSAYSSQYRKLHRASANLTDRKYRELSKVTPWTCPCCGETMMRSSKRTHRAKGCAPAGEENKEE